MLSLNAYGPFSYIAHHVKTVKLRSAYIHIALDKMGYLYNSFYLSPKKTCYGYSLEAPQRGTSNEYQQHLLSRRNKKISILMKKKKKKKKKKTLIWNPGPMVINFFLAELS